MPKSAKSNQPFEKPGIFVLNPRAMIEFEAYDKAISDDVRQQQLTAKAPLLCWDFHLQYSANRSRFSERDMLAIRALSLENDWDPDSSVLRRLADPDVVIVTTPEQEIVFASENLHAMNGYYPEEVIGKKPRIFQGPETELEARRKVAMAVAKKKPFSVRLTNYYKDGTTYRCEVKGFPVFDRSGKLVHFIAFEKAA
jgi:PAS domain S-box-containing protein